MNREYYMLSLYAQTLYGIERVILGKKPGLLDALAWICCILGIIIVLYRRFIGNPVVAHIVP